MLLSCSLSVDEGTELISFRTKEKVDLKLSRQFERAEMDSELAALLNPNEIKSGVSMVTECQAGITHSASVPHGRVFRFDKIHATSGQGRHQ
jgi:hypothetical protein